MDRVVSLGKRSAGDNDPLLVPLKRQKTVSITDLEEAGALSGFTNHVSLLRKHSGRASLRRSLPSTRRVVTSGTSGPEGLITGRPVSMCPTEAARNDECAPMEVDPGTAAMETCSDNSQDCAGTTQVVGDATDAAPGGPLEDEVRLISGVHPQCDPEYIREQLQANLYTPDRVSAVVFGIYDNPDYPTLAERQAIERQTLERQRLQNISLNIGLEQFLRLYTNPVETFYNEDTVKSDLYGEHAATKLRNDFRNLRMTFIRQCLRDHGGHLTPTYHKLKEEATKCPERVATKKQKLKYLISPREAVHDYPEEPDSDFYWEALFIDNEAEITEYLERRTQERLARIATARERGELHDCEICATEDVYEEDMLSCPAGHFHCRQCVRMAAESWASQGWTTFPCLSGQCEHNYSLFSLQQVLLERTLSLVVRRVQEEELRTARIPDLVSCPFCPYAVIIPGESSRVFHCENPECMKDSCRDCKEVEHIPLSCAEHRNNKQLSLRKHIESKMAEAIIRTCVKCGLRFVKEAGCNQMTCTKCGTSMCYVCREVISGYSHFRQPGVTCQSGGEHPDVVHRMEVRAAAEAADEHFREENPTITYEDLGFNPFKLLEIDATSAT